MEQGDWVMTAEEVAKFLRISVPKVHELSRSGQLPYRSFGPRSKRWTQADVEEFVDSAYCASEADEEDQRQRGQAVKSLKQTRWGK